MAVRSVLRLPTRPPVYSSELEDLYEIHIDPRRRSRGGSRLAGRGRAGILQEGHSGFARETRQGRRGCRGGDGAETFAQRELIEGVELEKEKGKLIYSYDIKTAGKSGIDEVNIDAMTGKIIAFEHESPAAEKKEAAEDAKKAAAVKPKKP